MSQNEGSGHIYFHRALMVKKHNRNNQLEINWSGFKILKPKEAIDPYQMGSSGDVLALE